MEAGGAGADGDRVGDSGEGGKGGFKLPKLGAEREVRGAEDGGYSFDLGLGDVGCGEGNSHAGKGWARLRRRSVRGMEARTSSMRGTMRSAAWPSP